MSKSSKPSNLRVRHEINLNANNTEILVKCDKKEVQSNAGNSENYAHPVRGPLQSIETQKNGVMSSGRVHLISAKAHKQDMHPRSRNIHESCDKKLRQQQKF